MGEFVLLLAPSANRVYAQATPALAAAELAITLPQAQDVRPSRIGGADALNFSATSPDLTRLAAQSAGLVCFQRVGDLLAPLDLPDVFVLPQELVTIPKYQGKTNELFTRLLLHLSLSQVQASGQLDILDPLAGRGTTLLTSWLAGHNGFGVEADVKSFEALAAYVKTYLRRSRIKHGASITPVRRDGRTLGRRFDVTARLASTNLTMSVFTGDTLDSAKLFGKRTFDAIVTDAPYGVVHGSRQDQTRRRSPAQLLAKAISVWAGQLRSGGALGLSWNTYGLGRKDLVTMLEQAGLQVRDDGAWT